MFQKLGMSSLLLGVFMLGFSADLQAFGFGAVGVGQTCSMYPALPGTHCAPGLTCVATNYTAFTGLGTCMYQNSFGPARPGWGRPGWRRPGFGGHRPGFGGPRVGPRPRC